MVLVNGTEYIYTDGSVAGPKNNQRGGSGVFFGTNDSRNLALRFYGPPVTSSRTELYAIYKALEVYIKTNWEILNTGIKLTPKKKIIIYSDSESCVDNYNNIDNLAQRGWIKKDGKPPADKDLLQVIYQIKKYYIHHLSIGMVWISSHTDPPVDIKSEAYFHWYGNYMADKLANIGRRSG